MTNSVIESVIMLVRETIGLPPAEQIASDDLLFYDLSFTSMDMLDLLFRVEQRFQISIPEGTIQGLARGSLSVQEFECDGILTTLGRQQLMELLYDSPPHIFPERVHIATLPRYCTVASIARLVEHQLQRSL